MAGGSGTFAAPRLDVLGGDATMQTAIGTSVRVVGALLVVVLAAGRGSAQVTSLLDAQVQSVFVSQSDSFQDSDPIGIPPLPPSGFGPYGLGGPLGLPAAPTPQVPVGVTPANPFLTGPFTSTFTDGATAPTKGQTWIDTGPLSGTNVVDANILMDLRLTNPTTLYAYVGMVFGANFYTLNSLGGGIGGAPPMIVGGNTTGGSAYAEAVATLDYYFATASSGFVGPFSPLGTLTYQWSISGTNPNFLVAVTPTGSLSNVVNPGGGGVIAIVGRAWLAGDPADIRMTIGSVPEIDPSGMASVLALLGGAVGVLERRRARGR